MHFGLWALKIYLILNGLGLLRLTGIFNITPYSLFLYRLLDLALIITFLLFWRQPVKMRLAELIMIFFVLLPVVTGIFNGHVNITMANDLATYLFFIIKVIIFRTLLISIYMRYHPDTFFATFSRSLIKLSLVIAIIGLTLALYISSKGVAFYFQSASEIKLAASLAIASNNIILSLSFLTIALLSGKRMIFIGILLMFLIAFMRSQRFRNQNTLFIAFALAFVFILGSLSVFPLFSDLSQSASYVRVDTTIRDIKAAVTYESDSLNEILFVLAPARYAEAVSLWRSLTNIDVLIGAGYGFRYTVDVPLFIANNFVVTGETVSNAHFSPIGIVSKFGIVGFVIWTIYLLTGLKALIAGPRTSWFRFGCALAFCAIWIESLFAFGFFINLFTPFVLAVCTVALPNKRATN